MNAAIRAVVRSADAAGLETYGVREGFAGLVAGRIAPLDARAVSGILHLGGSILGTSRSPRFRTTEGRQEALKHLDLAEIEGLVVIGGDGTFRGADALSREGHVRVVGIPGTIDNDVSGTDFTLGFDTAVNTALESIDRIRDTAENHGQLFFVEVMGRRSGWLALYAGLAGGGTEALVPEHPTDIQGLRKRVQETLALGKRFCLVIVSEGDAAGGAYEVAQRVAEGTGIEYRVTTLGHVQRGGSPTMRDRVLASVLGDAAVTALAEGVDRVMVGQRHGAVVRTSLEHAYSRAERSPDKLLDLMARLAR